MAVELEAFMTREPISIEPDAPALAALDLMIDHGFRHLPVVDASSHVCGVVSFDDLRDTLPGPISLMSPLAADTRQQVLDVSVADAMTSDPVTIRNDARLEEAVSRMLQGRFGCLPIVDEAGRLEAIVTETDLLRALATALWSSDEG
jgi:acetoin utilization protein AcuB